MRDSASEVADISDAVHLCIDMQNIFAPGGLWATPWMERVLSTMASIASRYQLEPSLRDSSRLRSRKIVRGVGGAIFIAETGGQVDLMTAEELAKFRRQ